MDFEEIEKLRDKDIEELFDMFNENNIAYWYDICICPGWKNNSFCHPGFAHRNSTLESCYYSPIAGTRYTGYRWCENHTFNGNRCYQAGCIVSETNICP